MIKKCNVTLKSVVDGAENKFQAEGFLEVLADKIKLSYREGTALTTLLFEGGNVRVNRTGDYALRLLLIEGAVTQGELEINGNVGGLEISTRQVTFSYTESRVSVCLRYDILFDESAQEMQLHIQANC